MTKAKIYIEFTHIDAGHNNLYRGVGREIALDDNFVANCDDLYKEHRQLFGQDSTGIKINAIPHTGEHLRFGRLLLDVIKKYPCISRVHSPNSFFTPEQHAEIDRLVALHSEFRKAAQNAERKIQWASTGMWLVGMLGGLSAYFSLGVILISNALAPKGIIGSLLNQRSLDDKLNQLGAKPVLEDGKWANRFYWALTFAGVAAVGTAFALEGTALAVLAGITVSASVLGWGTAIFRNRYLDSSKELYNTKEKIKAVNNPGEKAALELGTKATHWSGYLNSFIRYSAYRHPKAFAAGLQLANDEETKLVKAINKIKAR